MPAMAADVQNGLFNTGANWSFSGQGVPQYSEAQSYPDAPGAGSGSFLMDNTGRNKSFLGTASQSASILAGAEYTSVPVLWGMETGNLSNNAVVTVSLRYSDATTEDIFQGTVTAGQSWASIADTLGHAFPFTTTQDVNQININVQPDNQNDGSGRNDHDQSGHGTLSLGIVKKVHGNSKRK